MKIQNINMYYIASFSQNSLVAVSVIAGQLTYNNIHYILYIIKNYHIFNLKTCLLPIPSHDDFDFLWFYTKIILEYLNKLLE